MARERKGEQFSMRISKEAKEQIKNNAKLLGISQAKYIEKLAIEGCTIIEVRNDRYIDWIENKLQPTINKLGSNLNQIAAAANSGNYKKLDQNIGAINDARKMFDYLYKKFSEYEERVVIKNNNNGDI